MNTEPGTYEAFLDIMDAAGAYPVTRAEILDAIRQGVREAFADHLNQHPAHAQGCGGRVNVDTWRRRWSEPQQRTVTEGVYRPMLAACLPRPAEVVAAERADIKRRAQEAAAVLGIRWPIGDLPLSDDPTVASEDGPRPALTEPVRIRLHPALITREDHR